MNARVPDNHSILKPLVVEAKHAAVRHRVLLVPAQHPVLDVVEGVDEVAYRVAGVRVEVRPLVQVRRRPNHHEAVDHQCCESG